MPEDVELERGKPLATWVSETPSGEDAGGDYSARPLLNSPLGSGQGARQKNG
jgi:hypothetical protein